MGAPGYLVASSLRGIVAQRLIRKVCDNCSQDYQATAQELFWLSSIDASVKDVVFKHGRGCQKCNQTGYRGRLGVFELLEMTSEMMRALKMSDTMAFSEAAERSPNYKPLSHVALTYAKMGITTVKEVTKLIETVVEAQPSKPVEDLSHG